MAATKVKIQPTIASPIDHPTLKPLFSYFTAKIANPVTMKTTAQESDRKKSVCHCTNALGKKYLCYLQKSLFKKCNFLPLMVYPSSKKFNVCNA